MGWWIFVHSSELCFETWSSSGCLHQSLWWYYVRFSRNFSLLLKLWALFLLISGHMYFYIGQVSPLLWQNAWHNLNEGRREGGVLSLHLPRLSSIVGWWQGGCVRESEWIPTFLAFSIYLCLLSEPTACMITPFTLRLRLLYILSLLWKFLHRHSQGCVLIF